MQVALLPGSLCEADLKIFASRRHHAAVSSELCYLCNRKLTLTVSNPPVTALVAIINDLLL